MAKSKKRPFGMVWIGVFLGLLALTGLVLLAPLASANAPFTSDVGIVVMQTTPGGNTTPAASTPNSGPRATTQPNPGAYPNPVTPASSDNSWILWVILAVIVVAALAGGAWYYPRRGGTVVTRTETTDYRDDGPVGPVV